MKIQLNEISLIYHNPFKKNIYIKRVLDKNNVFPSKHNKEQLKADLFFAPRTSRYSYLKYQLCLKKL